MAQRTARLGRVTLGAGIPAVCVPVMGRTMAEIADGAARAKAAQADVIELRMDALAAMPDIGTAVSACRAAKQRETALLFTLRTGRDGGAGGEDKDAYEALLRGVAESGACDGIDCELSVGEAAFSRIARTAKAAGVTLVGSSHEFGEIGDANRAADWLLRQEALGADVCKAAVMAHSNIEALELMHAFAIAHERLSSPMIGIAMGPAGVLSRIGGACFGSCLTFGTAGRASAPGQIDAKSLRTALEIIHGATT